MPNVRLTPVELVADGESRFAEAENALLLVRLGAVTFLRSAGLSLVLVRPDIPRGPARASPDRGAGSRVVPSGGRRAPRPIGDFLGRPGTGGVEQEKNGTCGITIMGSGRTRPRTVRCEMALIEDVFESSVPG
jgi:hypothetical protein